MRVFTIAIAGVMMAAVLGCETAAPPRSAERMDVAPLPPEPARAGRGGGAEAADVAADAAEAPAAEPDAAAAGAADAPPAAAPAPDAPAAAPPAAAPPAAAPPAAAPQAKPADAPAANPPAEGDKLAKAEVGVGVKGKDYGGPGFVTTPIETLFRTNDRIAFEIQIPNSMKIYKAAHDNKGPKTHDEFMEVIVKENGVQLPELPAGSVYWYDAKSEELMVRTPKAP